MPVHRIRVRCFDRATYDKVCSLFSTLGVSVAASSNTARTLIVTSILTPKIREQLSELGAELEAL